MITTTDIGIDLGGTNIRAGKVGAGGVLLSSQAEPTRSAGSRQEVLEQLYALTDKVFDAGVRSIGVGVPGLVDLSTGTVYDVVNIPSWKEIALQEQLEQRYQVPVRVNNDANCFALGEYHFGAGKGQGSMAGLTLGTGLGTGIILEGRLYAGRHCGAGEFGMIDYGDHNLEYYASGQFFQNVYQVPGSEVFRLAAAGDAAAQDMYRAFGMHLGNAIKVVLYALDVDLVVLGGSVSSAWPWFREAMWSRIRTYAYNNGAESLRVEVSALQHSALLGAARLYEDHHNTNLSIQLLPNF